LGLGKKYYKTAQKKRKNKKDLTGWTRCNTPNSKKKKRKKEKKILQAGRVGWFWARSHARTASAGSPRARTRALNKTGKKKKR
jgi:hypothetical protein